VTFDLRLYERASAFEIDWTLQRFSDRLVEHGGLSFEVAKGSWGRVGYESLQVWLKPTAANL